MKAQDLNHSHIGQIFAGYGEIGNIDIYPDSIWAYGISDAQFTVILSPEDTITVYPWTPNIGDNVVARYEDKVLRGTAAGGDTFSTLAYIRVGGAVHTIRLDKWKVKLDEA